ncbi:MAG: DUF4115 domain-containing protein [Thermodesulfovibrionales bacterium]|nr:DUF4115 domain-containing protein [Thermodesulfovibrionales bacterium]
MVGEILRKRREELGLDLKEIAGITKIRHDYLKAIEDETLEKLPAEVYVKGYVREYAKILDIHPETVIDVYIQQTSTAKEKEVLRKEISQRKRLKIRYLLILLIPVITFASIILYPFAPEKQKMPSRPSETKKEDLLEAKYDTPLILEVIAKDTTWLLVNIDGTRSKEILLRPGESVKWDAKNSFSLKIGNAGGIKLIFNGKEIGPLGEKGKVIRLNLPPKD